MQKINKSLNYTEFRKQEEVSCLGAIEEPNREMKASSFLTRTQPIKSHGLCSHSPFNFFFFSKWWNLNSHFLQIPKKPIFAKRHLGVSLFRSTLWYVLQGPEKISEGSGPGGHSGATPTLSELSLTAFSLPWSWYVHAFLSPGTKLSFGTLQALLDVYFKVVPFWLRPCSSCENSLDISVRFCEQTVSTEAGCEKPSAHSSGKRGCFTETGPVQPLAHSFGLGYAYSKQDKKTFGLDPLGLSCFCLFVCFTLACFSLWAIWIELFML